MSKRELINTAGNYLAMVAKHYGMTTNSIPRDFQEAEEKFREAIEKEKQSIRKRKEKGTICTDCGQHTFSTNGCTLKFMLVDGSYYKRILMLPIDVNSKSKCHDCGVHTGQIHHIGCDVEICPVCKDGQLITCECIEVEDVRAINIKEK